MGTALQQARFKYNEMEELRYALLMRHRIDMSRVKLDVLMPWICNQISDIYNIEDFVYEELKKEQHVCPKIFQLKLLNFLSVYKVQQFTANLWEVLLVSQESGIGMPPFLMQQLKEDEILKREEEKKRKGNDSSKYRHCSCSRCSKRDDRVVDDKNSNQSPSKQEKSRSRDKQLDKNTSPRNRSKEKSVQRGYPSSDSCYPQSEKESTHSLKTFLSKSSQKKADNSCMRNSKSSSTSKYALRRCDDTSDDSDESPQCAWCGRTSSSPQSSVSSNRSRSPRRRSASREDGGKQEHRREKQIAEVVEKRKHSDVKNTTTIGSQTSAKRSKTSSENEITITPLSSLAMKGSSVPKSEHKKTKSDTESGKAVNGDKIVLQLVNCAQSAINNKCKKLKNDASHMNEQFQVKKKRKKSKKSSKSKRNSVDHCPRNSEAGSSKNKKH